MLPENLDQILLLITQNQGRLYSYILAVVGNREYAQDILQETNLIIWRKADTFTLGSNFQAWIFTIALNQIRAFRKQRGRDRLLFDESLMIQIAEEVEQFQDYDLRANALSLCLQKLPDKHRKIVHRRYFQDTPLTNIATEMKTSSNAIKSLLHRVRHTLLHCIQQQIDLKEAN
ncbi:ECF RNA polymerase sigma factor SigH [Poriferisphaera corsica]|uniref:ECF RNA polymerase sigma factor SigH n=1 Tax=Poriferisphaera corsica TaxID=2528020 RepID=A0A517YPT0_9BACT|nr:sigma-70 family RNA polymerase sigma factor [Poriferisphaera corsica]QDU32237.1 ECF RNA polymerase sigma factor SigH [Poriferisphaera corsica]